MSAITLMASGIVVSIVWMGVLWCISEKIKNAAIVDVGWGLSVFFYGVIYFVGTRGLQEKEVLALIAVCVWALRLSIYLYMDRIRGGKEEEGRYKKLREYFKENVSRKFFLFFQAQGVFNFFLSTPFLILALSPASKSGVAMWAAFVIALVGVLGESVSDYQLKKFKKNPVNKGKVCDSGLWSYSRHPNYFFEFVVWVGFFMFGAEEPYGFLGVVAPISILYTLLKFTGIPATEEQALRSKGALYKDYQSRVSIFIPWPPKK